MWKVDKWMDRHTDGHQILFTFLFGQLFLHLIPKEVQFFCRVNFDQYKVNLKWFFND